MRQIGADPLIANGDTRDYQDVVLAAPVTVPYVRYSIRNAHWFVARALSRLLKASGLEKSDIDGLSVGSFMLAPDTAIGLTQHLGVTVRWLDHVPLGGACGIVALRRALRAVQAGDAEVVACIGADTNHVDSFRQSLGSFSVFARDAVFPYGSGGPNASFAFLTSYYMRTYGATREDFGKICVAQRDNALGYPHAHVQEEAHPGGVPRRQARSRIRSGCSIASCPVPAPKAFLVMTRQRAEALGLPYATGALDLRAAQRVSGRSDPDAGRLGSRPGALVRRRRRRAVRHRLRANL